MGLALQALVDPQEGFGQRLWARAPGSGTIISGLQRGPESTVAGSSLLCLWFRGASADSICAASVCANRPLAQIFCLAIRGFHTGQHIWRSPRPGMWSVYRLRLSLSSSAITCRVPSCSPCGKKAVASTSTNFLMSLLPAIEQPAPAATAPCTHWRDQQRSSQVCLAPAQRSTPCAQVYKRGTLQQDGR